MAQARMLVEELDALRAQFIERAVDILHLETDVEQAFAMLRNPARGFGVAPVGLKQLDIYVWPTGNIARRVAYWGRNSSYSRSSPSLDWNSSRASLRDFTAMATCSIRLTFMRVLRVLIRNMLSHHALGSFEPE